MNHAHLVVGLYARVSSDRQAREHTIDSQLAELHARARGDGFEVPPELVFRDDGYSGAELGRPALERLRDTAAAGALDRLYVLCPDRLARDFALQILLLNEFERQGVEVVFQNHKADDSPEGDFLIQIQGVVAQYERALIYERSRRGRLHAARAGAVSVLSAAPYGYRYISKSEGDGKAAYQIVIEEARIVRQIFDWVGREGCSLGEVARRLRDQGVRTRAGKLAWDRITLRDMLVNNAYRGAAEYGKTRRVERTPRLRPRRGRPEFPRSNSCRRETPTSERIVIPVPPLIDDETFAAVQRRLAENRARHGRPAKPGRYLLQGLLVCSRCGRAYCGKTHKRLATSVESRYNYYRCIGTDADRFCGQRMCESRPVRGDRIDEAVWRDVRALLLEPDRIEAEYRRRLERESPATAPDHEANSRRIAGMKRQIARLTEMYEEGFLDRDAFRERMSAARSRLESLETEAAAAARRETDEIELRAVIGELEAFARRLQTGLDECDWETKQGIIRAVIKEIVLEDDTIRIVYKVSPCPFDPKPPKGGVSSYCKGRTRAPLGLRNSLPSKHLRLV